MRSVTLTRNASAANFTEGKGVGVKVVGKKLILPVLLAGSGALGGCIQVDAPTEPIVIELNINIRQEVIYRLAEDAGNTIDENADIF